MKRFNIFVSTAFLIAACNVFLQAQDLNTAIEAYNLGATAAQEGNYVTAIEHLDRALELGSALGEEGASVVTDCKNLIPQLYLRYAKELAANGDVASSLPFLDKAAETAVKYGDQTGIQDEVKDLTSKVYYIIANEAFGKKDFAGAIESYKKVLELDPTNGIAYLRLGQSAANSNMEDEAIASLQKAAEYGQADNARKLMASIYLKNALGAQKNKDWEQVYQSALKASELTDNVQSYKLLGLSAMELKRFPEALVAWENVMRADPQAKDINTTYYRLAVVNESLGNKSVACSFYNQILTDPNFKSIAEYKIKTELKCE